MHPLLSAALVVVSGAAVRGGHSSASDAAARRAIESLRTPRRDAAVRIATDIGSLYGVGVIAGALGVAGRPRLAVRVASAGATAWVLAQAAKPMIPRERPYQADGAERLVVEPAGSSWPSGHAAVAAAMAVTIGEGRGRPARLILCATAMAVGASRIYVGVHHASDVVAGFGIGGLSARLLRSLRR